MTTLRLPPGSRAPRVVCVPDGHVKLADGRVLRRGGRHVGTDETPQEGGWWRAPDGMTVIASLDLTPAHGRLLHVSLAYRTRDPSWKDIRLVRDAFYPETVDVMMVLPRAEDYVNTHEHCFHLWQTPTTWGLT